MQLSGLMSCRQVRTYTDQFHSYENVVATLCWERIQNVPFNCAGHAAIAYSCGLDVPGHVWGDLFPN